MKLIESLLYLGLFALAALGFMILADLIDKRMQKAKGVQPINGRIPDGPIAQRAIWVLMAIVVMIYAVYGQPDTSRDYGCYGSMRC
jgi:hypothetical protein